MNKKRSNILVNYDYGSKTKRQKNGGTMKKGIPGEYLVLTNYKGHPDSLVVTFPGNGDILEYLEKRKIRGIVEIVDPGFWDYDPETDVPRKI
jgi:hypothetical protein